MNEFVKDAPCLCKEDWQDDAKTTVKLDFFKKIQYYLLRLQKSRFAYPVMYDDGTISYAICDRIGRKPLGVVFENHLITLRASSKQRQWIDAIDYCKRIKVFGQSCEAGALKFWEKFTFEKCKMLNKTLFLLGGKRINLNSEYWSSTEHNIYNIWVMSFFEYHDLLGSTICSRESLGPCVCPVLNLRKLPLEVTAKFVWLT